MPAAADLSLTQSVKADSQPPVHISTDDLREDETELKLRFSEELHPVSGSTLEAGVSVGGGLPVHPMHFALTPVMRRFCW